MAIKKGTNLNTNTTYKNASSDDLKDWNYPKTENSDNSGGNNNSGATIPTTTKTADQTWREAIQNYGQEQKNYLNEYYNNLKDSSYKKLLNDRISASIAKAQALKSTNTALKANGYGSQGVADSNYASMNNAYINALGSANSSYNDTIASYNQEMASKMSEISQTQDQYYLNYLQQQATNERSDNEASFSDFLDGMSALTTDEAKAKYAEGRITTQDVKNEDGTTTTEYYLDGRKLSANEVTRYKSALANLDESTTTDTSSENAIKNSDNSMSYEPNGEMSIKYYNNYIQEQFNSNGEKDNTWTVSTKVEYENAFHAMDELLKSSAITNGTMIKFNGKSGNYIYAVYSNGKLYYIKDSQTKWNKTSSDNKITIAKDGTVTRGEKTYS